RTRVLTAPSTVRLVPEAKAAPCCDRSVPEAPARKPPPDESLPELRTSQTIAEDYAICSTSPPSAFNQHHQATAINNSQLHRFASLPSPPARPAALEAALKLGQPVVHRAQQIVGPIYAQFTAPLKHRNEVE